MLLKLGSSGESVKILQYALHILCYDAKGFDGVYGNNTFSAVKDFQKDYGLTVDGIVGDLTWQKQSHEILRIQIKLNSKGYNCLNDSMAGPKTLEEVKKFQNKNKLIPDGMVGEKTRDLLFALSYNDENIIIPPQEDIKEDNTLKDKVVYLDAGHGGTDPGAVGNGYKEKDITLNITLKVGKILKNNGVDVVYTRTTDTYVNFTLVPSLANKAKADLLISIHCNSFSDSTSNGTECYTASKASVETKEWSKKVADSLASGISLFNRGHKEAGYAVLKGTNMPAILIETAFISNSSDAQKLNSREDDFAKIIADCIIWKLNS